MDVEQEGNTPDRTGPLAPPTPVNSDGPSTTDGKDHLQSQALTTGEADQVSKEEADQAQSAAAQQPEPAQVPAPTEAPSAAVISDGLGVINDATGGPTTERPEEAEAAEPSSTGVLPSDGQAADAPDVNAGDDDRRPSDTEQASESVSLAGVAPEFNGQPAPGDQSAASSDAPFPGEQAAIATNAEEPSAQGAHDSNARSVPDGAVQPSDADTHDRFADGGEDGAAPELRALASSQPEPILGTFPPAPFVEGEFRLQLPELQIGAASGWRGDYNFESGPGRSLFSAAIAPDSLAPIAVMKVNSAWHVVDGWARVEALRRQFGDTANIMVRVVLWTGSEKDALYSRFAAEFLGLGSKKIDKARLLLQFHEAWHVPQQVLAARVGWTESKVSKQLAAATVSKEAPGFIKLLVKAEDPPIDYLWKVQRAREQAAEDDASHPRRAPHNSEVARLTKRLEDLLHKPERYEPKEALAKLGIEKPGSTKPASGEAGADPAPSEAPEIIDYVMGFDDEPIAAFEMTADNVVRIRFLIDPAAMSPHEKEEARGRLREAIDKFLS